MVYRDLPKYPNPGCRLISSEKSGPLADLNKIQYSGCYEGQVIAATATCLMAPGMSCSSRFQSSESMAVISEWVAWNGKYPPAGSIGERNTLSFLQKDRVLNMKYRTRTYYSAEQKAEMWDRWQRGESMNSIARLFDREHSSVQGILSTTGGIRPRERRRSRHVLTLVEREEISRIQGVTNSRGQITRTFHPQADL